MQKILFLLVLAPLFGAAQTAPAAFAPPTHYTVANAHSHNDYEQAVPFRWAYGASFGSIEADVYLVHDTLFTAHDTPELARHRTLEDWYIKPLDSCVASHGGYPYADTARMLQMLIEPKEDGVSIIAALLKILSRYPRLTTNPHLRWTITGHRPDPSTFAGYPSFIWFDGEFDKTYSPAALARVALFSDDFRNYSLWLGRIDLPGADRARLAAAVARAHAMGKPVRFWDAPDSPAAWKQLMALGADWINTDHIRALSEYLAVQAR